MMDLRCATSAISSAISARLLPLEIATGTDFAVPALTKPTELQERAFALLGLRPHPAPALTEKGMTTAKPVQ